jgi:hypothetical protein
MPQPRRRKSPASRPASPDPPHRFSRTATALWAALLASGLVGAVVTAVVNQNIGGASDTVRAVTGRDALIVHATAEDDLQPGPARIWALPRQLGVVRAAGTEELARVLAQGDATPLGATTYHVTLENQRSETATVTDIRAVVRSRSAPLSGAVVDATTGGGPTSGPVRLRFDLDDLDPSARDDKGGRYLDSSGLVLASGEKLRFAFTGATQTSYVEWDVEIRFVVNDTTHVVTTAEKRPFRSTAANRSYAEHFTWSSSRGLVPVTAADLCAGDCRDLIR